ncbi:MAG TPA: hypothetical protein VNU66_13120 [Mycobacteriales bacterium]|nr:hypothetical protein [Mycobacteriales bacterium]
MPRALGLRPDTAGAVAHTAWLRLADQDAVEPGPFLLATARAEAVRAASWHAVEAVVAPPDPVLSALDALPSRSRTLLRVLAAEPAPSEPELAAVLDVPVTVVGGAVAAALRRLAEGTGADETATLEALEALRRAVARHDPPPRALVTAARAAHSWSSLEVDLAPLADVPAGGDLVGVRDGAPDRALRFTAGDRTVDVDVEAAGAERSLTGALTPAVAAVVQVVAPAGAVEVRTDDLGRFVVDGLRAGPVRLVVTADGAPVLRTEWVAL